MISRKTDNFTGYILQDEKKFFFHAIDKIFYFISEGAGIFADMGENNLFSPDYFWYGYTTDGYQLAIYAGAREKELKANYKIKPGVYVVSRANACKYDMSKFQAVEFIGGPLKADFTNNYEDFFFTFNYTSVLERIYHIPSNHILHIHGGLLPYCDEPPIVGHGNIEKIELYHQIAEKAANEYDEGNESINNAIAKFYERTLKKTSECMAYKDDFFGQLKEVDHVEIIGHSFGRVDMPYFIHLK